jgi:2-polyprenyl-6-hydroxyphenyl methylase/3-demethylubiquinone-9 3-methyltransferase
VAALYGVVDFHKNCEMHRRKVLDVSGAPVYYHRCPACGFIFTTAFDHFTKDDFLRYIYNDEYLLVDPEYIEERPRGSATVLCQLFADVKPRRVLDYGGGNGVLAEALRTSGFADSQTYDPFVARHAARPRGRFDCVVSFEVLEHSTDPAGTIADMNEFLAETGLILLSTLVQPADIDQQGLSWWYAAPRNGHVSLFTKTSMAIIGQHFGFKCGSFNDSLHVFFRDIPEFARHFIKV